MSQKALIETSEATRRGSGVQPVRGATTPFRLLVIAADPQARAALAEGAARGGHDVEVAASFLDAEEGFRAARYDLVLLEHDTAPGTSTEALARFRSDEPLVPLIAITQNARSGPDRAAEAVRAGADQFLHRPVDPGLLSVVIERLLRRERRSAPRSSGQPAASAIDPFVGTSAAVRKLADDARRLAESDRPILLFGESGTGKGLIARWIHEHGARAGAPLVEVRCAGLSGEQFEADLFGQDRGDAAAGVGLLEVARRGSIFLDEVGDVPPEAQARLLALLEDMRYRRQGETRDRSADVRVIAATNKNLMHLARTGAFRSDLYYRVSTLALEVPPLRKRAPDVPALARELLERLAVELGRRAPELSPRAIDALSRYPWPGNVRELRNVLERAMLLTDGSIIDRGALRFDEVDLVSGAEPRATPRDEGTIEMSLEELERWHIERVLALEGGHVERAARRLRVPRSTLYERIKRYGIARG